MFSLTKLAQFTLLLINPVCAVVAQSTVIPIDLTRWTATDSMRTETYLGRPSLYINRGVALARDVALQDGTLEYDVAASPSTSFLGVVFRSRALDQTEVVFLRPAESGTEEAVQYAPALNGVVAAWQVYHGAGANAVALLPRERWLHVRVDLAADVATVYLDTATKPTLLIPHLAGTGGTRVGVWTGAYGRGAYFSNIRYSTHSPAIPGALPILKAGTITEWQLSKAFTAEDFTPERLPRLDRLEWDTVHAEVTGVVLVNRYRVGPLASLPRDSARRVLSDSVMTGKVAGSRVVYARATIDATHAEMRRLHYGYSDGIVIYLNGSPLAFAMNPQYFRGPGVMDTQGEALYLQLKAGKNELVFAVPEVGGGWAFWARLEPTRP